MTGDQVSFDPEFNDRLQIARIEAAAAAADERVKLGRRELLGDEVVCSGAEIEDFVRLSISGGGKESNR